MKRIPLYLFVLLLSAQTLFSFGVENIVSIGKNVGSDYLTKNLGNLNSLDLKKMGLDGLNFDDINSLNLGTFMSAFSIQCDMPSVPKIPNDICDGIDTSDFQINKSFDIGVCKVTVNTGGTTDSFNSAKSLLQDFCNRSKDTSSAVSQRINTALDLRENFDMKTNVKPDDITVESDYISGTTNIKTVDAEMPNGLKESQIYDPKNGVLGFDTIYKSGKKIPERLRNAFFDDDYATYRMYDRFAKNEDVNKLKNEDALNKFNPTIPKTYLEYKANITANALSIAGSFPTPYVIEKQLKRDLDRIKKEIGTDIQGSTSIEMKANYLVLKDKIMTELFKTKIESEWTTTKDGKQIQIDKPNQGALAKAIRDLEDYELTKFGGEEDIYKATHDTVVRPSQNKIETKKDKYKMAYTSKIFYQQKAETRRRAEKLREIKMKQEMLKLLAKKVFISNLEYKPEIAQKEIEEILQ